MSKKNNNSDYTWTLNVMGIPYTLKFVECVSKDELRRGQCDFLNCEIRIDKTMPESAQKQTLWHEILHAALDSLGHFDERDNETLINGLATALNDTTGSGEAWDFLFHKD